MCSWFGNAVGEDKKECDYVCMFFGTPLINCSMTRYLSLAVLEILRYTLYTLVSALRPPCFQAAHDTF